MNGAARVLDALLERGFLLTLQGGRLMLDSPLGHTLPENLRRRLRIYRGEIIAELTWRHEALGLVTDCLARVEAQHVPGCPLDDDGLRALEADVTAAFRAHDRVRLRHRLDDYRLACWTRFRRFREDGGRGP